MNPRDSTGYFYLSRTWSDQGQLENAVELGREVNINPADLPKSQRSGVEQFCDSVAAETLSDLVDVGTLHQA